MSTPNPGSSRSNKRQRLEERSRNQPSQKGKKDVKKLIDTDYYDPDQDPEQRRTVKKNLRSLVSTLRDSRAEYLAPGSQGLINTLREADQLYREVKQTSDATIDSRLLVDVADVSYKKVRSMTVGDSSVGIDVDDFINKCVLFMKKGTATGPPTSTQSQRRRRQQVDDNDEEGDNGDAMNWAHLGRNACFLHNSRPCLSGFLLGPLSVQKKVRQQTQRRAREARADPSQALRPIELATQDREQEESASLTQICTLISNLLAETIREGTDACEAEFAALNEEEQENMSHQKATVMMRRHGITDNGCVPLFDFCVNPRSFGQTVENMFYISFLVKEGKAGIAYDSDGFPTLGAPEQKGLEEKHESGAQRNQVVFALNHSMWKDLVESFGIKKSIIPHRPEDRVYDDGVIDTQALRGQSVRRGQSVAGTHQQDDEDSDMYG